MDVAKDNHRTNNDGKNYELLYDEGGCFKDGWEYAAESDYLHTFNMEYREWQEKKKALKGFVARLFTNGLNIYQKKYGWVIRKGCGYEDENGKWISVTKFNPDLHVKKEYQQKKSSTKA